MKTIIALLCMACSAYALDARSVFPAAPFQGANGPQAVGSSNSEVGFIVSGSWVRYDNLDFGPGPVIQVRIKAGAPNNRGGTIKVRHASITGTVIATVIVPSTGGFSNWRDFIAGVTPSFTPSGNQNTIFLEFTGGSDFLMNIAEFSFATTSRSWRSDVTAGEFLQESAPSDPATIDRNSTNLINITNSSWVDYGQFDFGDGMAYAWIEAAASSDSPQGVARVIKFRTGSQSGPVIGTVNVPNTNGLYKPFGIKFSPTVSGVKRLYLTFEGGPGNLFNLGRFRFQHLAPDHKPTPPITARIERDVTPWTNANTYTHESHPSDGGKIGRFGDGVGWIQSNTWVRYQNFNIPAGANRVSIEAHSGSGNVEVFIAPNSSTQPPTVTPLATFNGPLGGSWDNVRLLTKDITTTASGPQNVFFKFTGSLEFIRFRFDAYPSTAAAGYATGQDGSSGVVNLSGDPGVITVTDGDWARYDGVNFGDNANMISMNAATPSKGGIVEVRLGSQTSTPIARIDVTYTGNFGHYREYHAALASPISGPQTVFLKFVKIDDQTGDLFNLKNFIITKKAPEAAIPNDQGTLTVYPNVPGLEASPYYTYQVQKKDALNSPDKAQATNWLSTFAWFSRCRFNELYDGGYYDNHLAGWTHTYCNFEVGKNTPIVVKITRNTTSDGASGGPIFMANAHPAHKVESCEVIGGAVYVTMREPALVTVDIDGQMDTRDNPSRSYPETDQGRTDARKNGSHAVSIFANPVIADKPATPPTSPPTSGPILYVEPGGDATDKMNARSDWTTAYFLPGVHSFSGFNADVNGFKMPKKFESGDEYVPQNGKTFYIPGDAIVHGNFEGDELQNLRLYGLGTLSGRFIPHNYDSSWSTGNPYQAGEKVLANGRRKQPWGWLNGNMYGVNGEMLSFDKMTDCQIQGVTFADPANHCISANFGSGNSRRWIKQISWRANNDMGGIPGVVEDSFFRLADDALYVSDADFRRNTLWFDVNATPFRCSVIKNGQVRAENQAIIQDCDVIYMRSKFGGLGGDGIVSFVENENWFGVGKHTMNAPYTGTVNNTAQHVIFRNIRVTDARPERPFLSLNLTSNDGGGGVSGIRFENFEMRHPYNGWSKVLGNSLAPISHLYFDGVTIEGKKLTRALFEDPTRFQVSSPAFNTEFVFRDAPSGFGSGAPSQGFELNINSGGPAYNATDGSVFQAGIEGSTYSTSSPISGTDDDTLYQSERYGDSFSYNIPVTNGDYEVTLMFAEILHTQANQRVFHVDIEGARVINNLDIWARVGKDAAYNEQHVTSVNDGQLNITFSGVLDNAKVSAIKIKKVLATYILAITPPSNGSISTNPTGTAHVEGTDVMLTATPASGYRFVYWSGSLSGSTNPETITMSENRAVTAVFRPMAATLFVVGNAASMNAADSAIRDRLVSHGHNVETISASASTTASATGKTLVVTSSTVTSSDVNTKFRDVSVPVINWETALQDDYFGNSLANQGTSGPQTLLNIVAPLHPLAAGFALGNRAVATSADGSGFSWGEPGGTPIIVARLIDGSNRPCLYAYETGATMTVGTASARRVNLFLQGNTFSTLNDDGLKLFDAAVGWAIGDLPPFVEIPLTGFALWASELAVVGGPAGDDDYDGRTNLAEYAFGQNPKNGASVNPVSVSPSMAGGTFSYTRRKLSLTALTYSVWYSTSLATGSWTRDTSAIEGTPSLVGDVETVPVTLSPALLTNPTLFIQVRAE